MLKENFNLENDEEILNITSPKDRLKGPYVVVYKNIQEEWAIVAFDWDSVPSLGIRWFYGEKGNPISNFQPTWFIIPLTLANAVLNGLPLDFQFRNKLNCFLANKITSEQLKKKGE